MKSACRWLLAATFGAAAPVSGLAVAQEREDAGADALLRRVAAL